MTSDAPRFQTLRSRLMPLLIDDVDTDQIIPAEYLKTTGRDGLAEGLFAEWRRDPDCVLHREDFRGAEILLAGDNFGCGSSREHAPWALLDYGFRAILSPCFADIFRINALRNGLLAVAIEQPLHRQLVEIVEQDPQAEITMDLETLTLTLPDGAGVGFNVDPFARRCLLEGIDQLGYLLRQEPQISEYESHHPPWTDTRHPEAQAS